MHHIHHYQLCKLWCSSLSFCFGSIRKCGFVAPCHLVKLLHAEICQNTFFFFFLAQDSTAWNSSSHAFFMASSTYKTCPGPVQLGKLEQHSLTSTCQYYGPRR